MNKYEILTLVIATLGYLTGLITVWVRMNVKIAIVDTKIASLQAEFMEHKTQNERDFDKFIEENRQDHQNLLKYLSEAGKDLATVREKIVELATIQNERKTYTRKRNTKPNEKNTNTKRS